MGTSFAPLPGGHSGRTFVGDVAGERAVVRIYPPGDARGPEAPETDAAVLRLVRGLLPVPDVVDVRREDAAAGQPGLLVTSWMPGERGDLVAPGLDEAGWRRFGRAMGHAAATLAGMPVLRPGPFVGTALELGEFPDEDLSEWVESRLAGWSVSDRSRLAGVADEAQDVLDALRRTCLVHSDLNPKNVLVDPATLELTAVLDWEFAHAGHPWTDVGNLLRFERHPAYVEAVLEAWTTLRGGSPDALLDGARAADLRALVDLAARAGDHPVANRAASLVHAIAESGDLHAWPDGS
ncbi:Phosphotransferase enzyme family protein [Nocardioides alpinus]|uniref:Phosphotransferase enzyme family protein n=1 Tax=Nocardioides alpinus TaxID=748909 RepID=A0A1I1B6N6_9ACTN|nr:phosphotransferase [Nocardioides alpinus]PKH41491.1 translation initiation factor IF-2 [Nocardioides alpinus]SFB44193.1 Phosphotransferase enzyme family protein [Nocardioides alpinus]